MCGICGYYSDDISPLLIREMAERLKARGPDDEGFHFGKGMCLGVRRLSIIDIKGGHQPFYNENRSICAIMNGEIYNFQALKKELEGKGHLFNTHSDTEVLTHSYEEWGFDFVKKLRGMFAIAVWDENKKLLILVRDRLGIKPLYYANIDQGISFASEIKSILLDERIDRGIDMEGLSLFLSLNYIPAPWTIFRGIKSLLPGNMLIFSKGDCRLMEYWDIPVQSGMESGNKKYERDYAGLVKEKLRETVKKHLYSDVPVGIFLSGGLDSSIVAVLASQIHGGRINTFSIGFREESYSELPFAEVVSRHVNSNHWTWLVEPREIQEDICNLITYFDQPFGDSSSIAVYYVSRLAKEHHVKVVLTGDGGDELFAGYETYLADRYLPYYLRLPGFLKNRIARYVEKLQVSDKKMSLEFKLKRFIKGAVEDPRKAHLSWRMIFSEDDKKRLLSKDVQNDLGKDDILNRLDSYFEKPGTQDPIDKFTYFDTRAYLPNDMLTKVDMMSMMNSVEARVPLLDHEFVETAFQVPSKLKVGFLKGKRIMRKAFSDMLPGEILSRPKEGFNIPIGLWLNRELKDIVRDTILSRNVMDSVFDMDYIKSLLKEHEMNKRDNSHQLWGLFVFSHWYQSNKL